MVALFVILSFLFFVGIDLVLHKSKWVNVLKEAPGTVEAPAADSLYNMPEVGLTMADGQREEDKEEEKK